MGAEAAGAFIALIFIVFWFMFIFAIITIGSLFTVFWIWMLIDAIQRDYKNENDKVLWIVVIALTGFIGALIYYFVVKHKERTKPKKSSKQIVSNQKGSSGKSR
ncbi:MAG: PLDc N-terminal domain-containing protein [Candidatus Woesearchaeota archaeon]